MSPTMPMDLADELFDESQRLLSSFQLPRRLLADPQACELDDSWRAVAQAGWFRTIVAEQDGGLGLGLRELGAVFRAVGHRLLRGPLLDHAVTVPLVFAHAGPAVRERLTASLDGSAVTVLAEDPPPPFGSGPAAARFADGYLDGMVSLVPFASVADHLVLSARGPDGPALVLIDTAHLAVSPTHSGDPTLDYGTVQINHVPVGPRDIIATGEHAAALRSRIRGALQLMAVAELSGAAEELTALAADYAKTRRQFGRPIGGFQALRHILAEMAARTSALRSFADAACEDANADARRWAELGRAAKAFSAEPARFVAEQCIQVHGGMGFTYETTPHLYLRRVLTLEGHLGEAADLMLEIGQEETR